MDVLAVVDTPSIKKYVFETPHLVDIEGASALLDRLNRIELPKLLAETDVQTVYANGGSGQFIFRDSTIAEAEEMLRRAEGLYSEATNGGAALAWAAVPYEGSYNAVVQAAFAKLRAKRDLSAPLSAESFLPLVKLCEACHSRPVSQLYRIPESIWLCSICATKRRTAHAIRHGHDDTRFGLWYQFEDFLGYKVSRPQKLPDIADRIALIYADGNAMGRRIRQITTPEDYRTFSEAVDKAVREACYTALADLVMGNERSAEISASILLLGGDDLVVVVPADKGLQIAYKIGRTYEELTHEYLGDFLKRNGMGTKLTLSFGVAISRHSHPFEYLIDAAQQLLASAKVRGTNINPDDPPSCIDFHLAQTTSHVDIECARSHYGHLGTEGHYKPTRRPYTLEDLEILTRVAAHLKNANYPTSQLNALYESLFSTPAQAEMIAREIWARNKDKARKALRTAMEMANCFSPLPWSPEGDTILSELVEFYDLLPERPLRGDNSA